MVDNLKNSVATLQSDGLNWVNYHNWTIWSLRLWGLLEHLVSSSITQTYVTIGNIQNMTPQMWWDANKAITMQVIAALTLDIVFTNIKSKTAAKDIWDTLKALFEGRTTMVLVWLSQQLQSACCGDDNNVCKHFEKLANLQEQLAAMGKSMPDNKYTLILLGSLPMTYAGIIRKTGISLITLSCP